MNYKLCSCDKKELNVIDISKLYAQKKDMYNLENIDKLTMNFKDDYEAKIYLIGKNISSTSIFNKELKIIYGDKHKREIPVIYKGSKKTYDDLRKFSVDILNYFEYCKNRTNNDFSYSLIMGEYPDLRSHFKCFSVFAGNHKFLVELQKYCSNNPEQNTNISDITTYLNMFSQDKQSRLIYIALYDLFRKLFYDFDKENKELNFSYKSFRDFVVFYNDYKNSLLDKEKQYTKKI